MVRINGRDVDAAGKTLLDYLNEENIPQTHVAIERNEEIIAKDDYKTTVIEENDVIEIVRFVGGGC